MVTGDVDQNIRTGDGVGETSPVSESTPDRREAAITWCPCTLSLVAGFVPSTVGHPRWLACSRRHCLGIQGFRSLRFIIK